MRLVMDKLACVQSIFNLLLIVAIDGHSNKFTTKSVSRRRHPSQIRLLFFVIVMERASSVDDLTQYGKYGNLITYVREKCFLTSGIS